jgi:uncharacterized protein YciI
MEYFFYCRDKPGSASIRAGLFEEHWSFMDGYADAMVARGPTLAPDGETATGSMHIVDLPDAAAAQVFAYEEPNYRAGVYSDVVIRRWRNTLGRTMWDYPHREPAGQRFLVIAHGRPGMTDIHHELVDEHRRYVVEGGYADNLIVSGPLLGDDGEEWLGSAFAIDLADRAALGALFADDPIARAGLYAEIEIHDWRFGGRPDHADASK